MSIKLFACGDVVNTTDNKYWLSDQIKNIIKCSDFSVANFEAPIAAQNMQPISKAGPHLYQSVSSIAYLKKAGFTHVSLANNHIYDYGEIAFKKTIEELHNQGVGFVGAGSTFEESYQSKIIEKNGLKVGLLAACENEFGCHYDDALRRAGYAWLFHYRLEEEIKYLNGFVDYIVLMAHSGVEHIPIPIKEWRDRYKRLCDLGVDVVIGHHPHVPQGYESYKNGYIFYSLGNFYFDTPAFVNKSDDSYSVVLCFEKRRKVTFEIFYHKKCKGVTELVERNAVYFDLVGLNLLLKEGYEELNNKYALNLYEAYYKSYYKSSAGISPSIKVKVKKIIKLFIKMSGGDNESNKGLLLLHNIRIDSHRFTVQRALSLKYEK